MSLTDDIRVALREELSSPSAAIARGAVERVGELLQSGMTDEDLVDRLCNAATHPKWQVRKATAYALLFINDEKFEAPISRLLSDENAFVRTQANHTMSKRTVRKRTDPLDEEHGTVVRAELEDLERRDGVGARRACERVALKTTELIVRELHHELITVITPLESQLGRLHSQAEDARTRETLSKAKTHVSRIETVLRSMLDYTAETVLEPTTIRIATLVAHAIEAVRSVSERPIVVELTASADAEIVADFNRLSQAMVNILRNAVEASAQAECEAEVAVKVTQDDSGTVISVADNGPGFPSFDEPVRRYATSKPHGLGFGLAVAKKIVETEHGGYLGLSNAPEGGAVVTLRIPHTDQMTDAN